MNRNVRYVVVEGACLIIAIIGILYIVSRVTADYTKKSTVSVTVESAASSIMLNYEADFSAGSYQVGKDLPSGTYDITLVSGNGNVVAVSSGLNTVFGTSTDSYISEYKGIKLLENDTLLLTQDVIVHLKATA
jgi:hypothetical protein